MGSVFDPAWKAGGQVKAVGQIEELIGCSSQGIVCLNESGEVLLFNQRASRMLRTPVSETVGRPFAELLRPSDRTAWVNEFERLKATDHASLTFRNPIRISGGSGPGRSVLEASVTQTITSTERLYTVFLEDVTDLVEAEGRLQQLNQELEAKAEELRVSTERLSVLLAFSDYLQSCLTMEEAASEVARFGRRTFAPGGALFVRSLQDSGRFAPLSSWGAGSELPSFDPDECWAIRRGSAHFSGEDESPVCRHLESDATRFVCLPLAARGSCLGVLTVHGEGHEKEYLLAVADAVRIRLANIQQEQSLRTGFLLEDEWHLTAKGTFMEALRLEIERARRSRVPVSLAWFDVRKPSAMPELTTAIRSHLRTRDWAAKLDARSLTVLAPETPPSALESVCREVIASEPVRSGAAAGVAVLGPVSDTAGSLLEAARLAARQAPEGQVVLAPRQPWPGA
jgi:PAS domain-containing protein